MSLLAKIEKRKIILFTVVLVTVLMFLSGFNVFAGSTNDDSYVHIAVGPSGQFKLIDSPDELGPRETLIVLATKDCIEALRDRIESLEEWAGDWPYEFECECDCVERMGSIEANLFALEDEVDGISNDLGAIGSDITGLESRVSSLEDAVATLVNEIEALRDLLEQPTVTPEQYFTFDKDTGTITDYDADGGLDVIIPSEIDGVAVEIIGDRSFSWKDLTSVVIPDSVHTIGDRAFFINHLDNITIGNGVIIIDEYAFDDNKLTHVIIPDSVEFIGDQSFGRNSLVKLTIGNNVKIIDRFAFKDSELTEITIPDSVEEIRSQAFSGNPLDRITIGANVDVADTTGTMGTNFGFQSVYNDAGKVAGTYEYDVVDGWEKQ